MNDLPPPKRRNVRKLIWAKIGSTDKQRKKVIDPTVERENALRLGLPWHVRGPPGPDDGGHWTWGKQRWSRTKSIWYHPGGAKSAQWDLWRAKRRQGLSGAALWAWKPSNPNNINTAPLRTPKYVNPNQLPGKGHCGKNKSSSKGGDKYHGKAGMQSRKGEPSWKGAGKYNGQQRTFFAASSSSCTYVEREDGHMTIECSGKRPYSP